MKHISLLLILILPSFILNLEWQIIQDMTSYKIKKIAKFASEITEHDYPGYPYHLTVGYSYFYKGENYYFVFAMFDKNKKEMFFYLVFIEYTEEPGKTTMKVYQKYVEKKTKNINIHHHYFIIFQPAVISYLYDKEGVIVDYIEEINQYQNCISIVVKTYDNYDYYVAGWKELYSSTTDDNFMLKAYFKIKK